MKKHFLSGSARGHLLCLNEKDKVLAAVSLEGQLNIETALRPVRLSLLPEKDGTQEELKCNAKVFFLSQAARLLMMCQIKS